MASELVKIFERRELIRNLVARQLKVRYKSSSLGFVWSLLNPLLMMLVYWAVFSQVLARNAGLENFQVYILCGLFPWYFFAGALSDSTSAIVGNVSLVKRIYFPRIILPLSTTVTNLVNFLFSLVVLGILLVIWQPSVGMPLLLLPVIIALEFILALGFALFLAPLNALFRDVEHMLQVILLAGMFTTPAVYPYWKDFVPERYWGLYFANPMACIIAAYQKILWGYFDGGPSLQHLLFVPLCWAVVLLVGGYFFMRKMEGTVVDQL